MKNQTLVNIFALITMTTFLACGSQKSTPNSETVNNNNETVIEDPEKLENSETTESNGIEKDDIEKEKVDSAAFFQKFDSYTSHGTGKIQALKSGSNIEGQIKILSKTSHSFIVLVYATGLTPLAKHAVHIHENASCDDNGNAAGGHFDPFKTNHHGKPNEKNSHLGDLGMLSADKNGIVQFHQEITIEANESNPSMDFRNRSLIIHEKEDHFTQPSGDAGSRIACGIIK
jgi:Cu-Zn family superoxide dismutase